MHENQLSDLIIQTCIDIHRQLGPGLLESVYEQILAIELQKKNLCLEKQKEIHVIWDNTEIGIGFRADLIVENKVIIELKTVGKIEPVHKKQLLTYLKITGLKLGLLINFNEELIKQGITRVVNNL